MKVLINVKVPSIQNDFDLWVPEFLTVKEIVKLLGDAIQDLSNNTYISSKHELLCDAEKKCVLKEDKTFAQYGVKNGDHFILM